MTARSAEGRYIGLTANSFTSVSLEPALVSWSLRRASALFDTFSRAGHFAVHVLGASQADLAARFAARFECEAVACHGAGEHGIFIGRVERYTNTERAELPLVFCQGGYTALGERPCS